MLNKAKKDHVANRRIEEQRKHDDMIKYALDAFETTTKEIIDHVTNDINITRGEYNFSKHVKCFMDNNLIYAGGFCSNVNMI